MSEQIVTNFVLTGSLKGKTIVLGSQGFSFVEGKMETRMSVEDTDSIARFLKRNWQVVPEHEVPVEPIKASITPKANEAEAKKVKSRDQ